MELAELNKKEQDFLLKLARKSIKRFLKTKKRLKPDKKDCFSKKLLEKKACFVTLTKRGSLRGCIGSIQASHSLIEDVAFNAVQAAFFDPRFFSVSEQELNSIKIDISVLSVPIEGGIDEIQPLKHGVVLSMNRKQALFLPSVWKQIFLKDDFLSQLCLKAGLTADGWKSEEIKVKLFEVQEFEEKI